MIAELTRDWIGDRIRDQSKMINEMAMERTLELIPEMIPELTGDPAEIGDPDGCPLTEGGTPGFDDPHLLLRWLPRIEDLY